MLSQLFFEGVLSGDKFISGVLSSQNFCGCSVVAKNYCWCYVRAKILSLYINVLYNQKIEQKYHPAVFFHNFTVNPAIFIFYSILSDSILKSQQYHKIDTNFLKDLNISQKRCLRAIVSIKVKIQIYNILGYHLILKHLLNICVNRL